MLQSCFTMNSNNSHCRYFAAAATSARLAVIMDTALCAVSILLVRLVGLIIFGM